MYKQNCYILKTLDQMPKKAKKTILENCEAEFVRFLVECVVTLTLGNLPGVQKKQLQKHLPILHDIYSFKQKKFRTKQRKLLASDRGIGLITYLTPAIISRFC